MASDNDLKKRRIGEFILRPFDLVERYYVYHGFKYATHLVTQTGYQRSEIRGNMAVKVFMYLNHALFQIKEIY